MGNPMLYYPDGRMTFNSPKDFVDFYSQAYYYRAGNTALERKMDKLLVAESLSDDDIADILTWKTGGSLDQNTGVLTYGYKATIHVNEVAKAVRGKKAPHLEKPAATLCQLCSQDGIGFTIAMTLMCFLSDGSLPIYDRFAHLALAAIRSGRQPGRIIKEKGLVLSFEVGSEDTARQALGRYQAEFASLLVSDNQGGLLLGIPYCRDVDRALWAYGHLFNDTALNRCRISH